MISTEIHIEGSKTMPDIKFRDGKLSIVGRSVPTSSKEWFDPLMQVLMFYAQDPQDVTEINIDLDYLNSDSNRSLLNLLLFAEQIHSKGKKVVIKWFYKNNDVTMFDQGNIFSSLIEVPFKLEAVN